VRGWIRTEGELVHVMARPDAGGDWASGDVLVANENALLRAGASMDFTCQQEQVSPTTPQLRPPTTRSTAASTSSFFI